MREEKFTEEAAEEFLLSLGGEEGKEYFEEAKHQNSNYFQEHFNGEDPWNELEEDFLLFQKSK